MKKFLILSAAISVLVGCASNDSRIGAGAPGSSSGSIGGIGSSDGVGAPDYHSGPPSLPGSTRDSGTGDGSGTGSGTGTGTGLPRNASI